MAAKRNRHNFLKYLIAGGALIFFWRGLWGLLDIYLLPHAPVASYAISMIIGVVLLILDDRYLKELENH